MGFLSDLGHDVAAAVDNRGLFGSVNNEFKRFADTDLGKAVLIGAAIYFGGAAAGWWEAPWAAGAAEGAAAEGVGFGGGIDAAAITPEAVLAPAEASAASAASAATTPAAPWGPANFGAIDNPALTNPVAVNAGPAAPGGVAPGASVVPPASPMTPPPATPGGGAAQLPGANLSAQEMFGNLNKPASGNWFTGLHPLAQYGLLQSGLGAVQNAFTPNAVDVAREQARLAEEADARRRAVWNKNWNVSGINLNVTPSPAGLLNGGQ